MAKRGARGASGRRTSAKKEIAQSGRQRSARGRSQRKAPESRRSGGRSKRHREPEPEAPRRERVEHLPRSGARANRNPVHAEVRRVVADLREVCGACAYRRICAFAPVKLQIERSADRRAKHRHEPVLRRGIRRLARLGEGWEDGLVAMLAGREKDALLATCLLAEGWRSQSKEIRRLIEYTAERCDVDRLKAEALELPSKDSTGLAPGQGIDPELLQTRMFRGQVLRLAAFFADPDVLGAMQEILVLAPDDDGRLDQYEAVAVLALLIGRRMPADRWISALEKDAKGPFRSTFAVRDPGNGGLDLFFPYRRGKRRSYLYYRRDAEGKERVSSVDKVRIDSLLHRLFVVFHTDVTKTYRVFKELCRHVNVRAGEYNVNHVLEGFERLDRDDLLLLGIFAPALARAVGHFLGIEGYHRLVKLLYALRSDSGRRGDAKVPCHEKVVQAQGEWEGIVEDLGADLIKDVFSVLFRLNASYKKRAYTSPTYLKIGEVAYLLTAMAGWNPKGLEIELKQAKKSLAFVAYGLQPPGRWSKARVGKLRRAHERVVDRDRAEHVRAVEQGMYYMALLHGFDTFAELEQEAASSQWEAPARPAAPPSEALHGSGDDFSDFPESQESGLAEIEEEAGDLFVVVEDDQTDEAGRLITQRMKKQSARQRKASRDEPRAKRRKRSRKDDGGRRSKRRRER